jgi:transcriptional regulator with XRE-family HTH domain
LIARRKSGTLDVVAERRVSPTVRRRRLGAELRRYREATGWTIDAVAERIECSASKISRIENGQTGASPRDVRDLAALYKIPTEEAEDLVAIATETRKRGWWHMYGSVLTSAYVSFEGAADSIRAFEGLCIPGLLQTEEYARAIFQSARPALYAGEITDRVSVRMARAGILTEDDPTEFWCIIDEAAIRRPIGGHDVMRRQLEHLAELMSWPSVTVQVMPFEAGAHPGLEGSFIIFSFASQADADTVYVAMATGGVFLEKPEEIVRYTRIFDALQEVALSPADSRAMVAKLAKAH